MLILEYHHHLLIKVSVIVQIEDINLMLQSTLLLAQVVFLELLNKGNNGKLAIRTSILVPLFILKVGVVQEYQHNFQLLPPLSTMLLDLL
jgi:hypothetical protein